MRNSSEIKINIINILFNIILTRIRYLTFFLQTLINSEDYGETNGSCWVFCKFDDFYQKKTVKVICPFDYQSKVLLEPLSCKKKKKILIINSSFSKLTCILTASSYIKSEEEKRKKIKTGEGEEAKQLTVGGEGRTDELFGDFYFCWSLPLYFIFLLKGILIWKLKSFEPETQDNCSKDNILTHYISQ